MDDWPHSRQRSIRDLHPSVRTSRRDRLRVMSAVDLATRSATELAGLIRTREVSAAEVVDATLARIETLNPSLNAFISVDRDRARREAAAADADIRRGDAGGP